MSQPSFIKRGFVKHSLMLITALALGALLLGVFVDTSAAQGPGGGRGNGRGGNGQGQQAGGGQGSNGQSLGDGTGQGSSQGNGQQGSGMGLNNCDAECLEDTLPPATPGALPADVISALNAGLQDEYHAYATYQVVIDQFGTVRPFLSIQQSEAQHIDLLAFLFERYGLDLPAATPLDAVPVFASVEDACATGAAAEIANFELYDAWITTVEDYPDIVQVFTQLRDASEFQHLPAFERCAGF